MDVYSRGEGRFGSEEGGVLTGVYKQAPLGCKVNRLKLREEEGKIRVEAPIIVQVRVNGP